MSIEPGQRVQDLETPQLLIDLDIVDANLDRLFRACREKGIDVRVHFKSLKCSGLARYIADHGGKSFLCAKLNEAEVLADAGLTDILIANQIIGEIKLRRLAQLARRAQIRVCVDDTGNVEQMARIDASCQQRIALQVGGLAIIVGGDAHVADEHVRKTGLSRFSYALPLRYCFPHRISGGSVGRMGGCNRPDAKQLFPDTAPE